MPRAGDQALPPRIRAAWAFSGASYDELATRTGIKEATLRGYLRRARPVAPTLEDAFAIADACNVPHAFMEHGFVTAGEQDIAQRLHAVEQVVAQLAATRPSGAAPLDALDAAGPLLREAVQRYSGQPPAETREEPGALGGSAQ